MIVIILIEIDCDFVKLTNGHWKSKHDKLVDCSHFAVYCREKIRTIYFISMHSNILLYIVYFSQLKMIQTVNWKLPRDSVSKRPNVPKHFSGTILQNAHRKNVSKIWILKCNKLNERRFGSTTDSYKMQQRFFGFRCERKREAKWTLLNSYTTNSSSNNNDRNTIQSREWEY